MEYSYPYKQLQTYSSLLPNRTSGVTLSRDEASAEAYLRDLTDAGRTLVEAVFCFDDVTSIRIDIRHQYITVYTNFEMLGTSRVRLDRIFELLNNLMDWAFVQDVKYQIIDPARAATIFSASRQAVSGFRGSVSLPPGMPTHSQRRPPSL